MDAHRFSPDKVIAEFNSLSGGLSEKMAKDRFLQHGPNQLTGKKKITAVVIFFRQFLNPLVYVLVAAATIKAVVKGPLDALTIVAVLLFMAIVGFIQEFRAGKAMDALLQLSAPKAKVKRDGRSGLFRPGTLFRVMLLFWRRETKCLLTDVCLRLRR